MNDGSVFYARFNAR